MNITILGAGAYGIALSSIVSKNNFNVTIWTKIKSEYDELTKKRSNNKALPGYIINKNIKITMDMQEAIINANLIIVAIPIAYIYNTILEMKKYYKNTQHICIASKGILQNKLYFPYTIVRKTIKTKNIGIISGGTFAVDIVMNIPIGLTIASKNNQTTKTIKKSLENENVLLSTSKDVWGIEFFGAIKNVIAIGCGIIEGLNLPESTRCLFFTKCFNDLMDLVYSLNGNKNSILTYAGIGDLFLTCTSVKSRNYTYGKLIGSNVSKEEIKKYTSNTTIEGLYTLQSLHDMLKKRKRKSPLINTIYDIVYNGAKPDKIIDYFNK